LKSKNKWKTTVKTWRKLKTTKNLEKTTTNKKNEKTQKNTQRILIVLVRISNEASPTTTS